VIIEMRHPDEAPPKGEQDTVPCPLFLLHQKGENGASLPSAELLGGHPSDEQVLSQSRDWVEAIIVKMKVCPFSGTADLAGMPQGGVAYPITHGARAEQVIADFWNQVVKLQSSSSKDMATVLLLAPRFAEDSPELWHELERYLILCLGMLQLSGSWSLVFFHPQYTFHSANLPGDLTLDKMGGENSAVHYARRSPFPIINILRQSMVRKAQEHLKDSVYITNARNCQKVGNADFQQMLEARDWKGVFDKQYLPHKRKDLDTKV